ncbi:hypothetical protein [Flavobacterium sp.]|uniref:hypothetical protein n=1 Tax=Flavobacterium sp. TaxID=239 RepID=UPI003752AAAA
MKKLIVLLVVLFSSYSFSQEITIQKGRYYVNGQQISSRETKEKLASNPRALSLFKEGKRKEANGGFLLGFGIAITVADAVKGLVSDVKYPGPATIVGVSVIALSIPVLIGKNKKMREGIEMYNNGLKSTGFNDNLEINILANQNGYGIQLRF